MTAHDAAACGSRVLDLLQRPAVQDCGVFVSQPRRLVYSLRAHCTTLAPALDAFSASSDDSPTEAAQTLLERGLNAQLVSLDEFVTKRRRAGYDDSASLARVYWDRDIACAVQVFFGDGSLAWNTIVVFTQPSVIVEVVPPTCAHCGADTMKVCGRCQRTRYCSVTCQRGAWPQHRATCRALPDSVTMIHV